jgi:hypothetical protein
VVFLVTKGDPTVDFDKDYEQDEYYHERNNFYPILKELNDKFGTSTDKIV